MNKIVYLMDQPLDARNHERFGIQTWIDRGWNIEVWDLTPLLYPQVWQDFIKLGRSVKSFDGYFAITSSIELKRRYINLEKGLFYIDLLGDDINAIRIKMHLKRIGATRIVCALGSVPGLDWNRKSNLRERISKAIRLGPIKLFKWVLGVALRKLTASLIRPEMAIVSGTQSLHSLMHTNEIIRTHNFDYDIYLKIDKSIKTMESGHVVFIDQDLCFHSDAGYVSGGFSFPVTPEKYFPSINNVLNRISEVMGATRCIAAHPRSSYNHSKSDYFEGIPIKYGSTAELIKDCSVVLCHCSTAIQFAILFNKPVVFVTTDELDSSIYAPYIAFFASEFGKTVINIDKSLDKVDWQREMHVDLEKYAAYRNTYIKIDGSPKKPIWDIVIDQIEEYKDENHLHLENRLGQSATTSVGPS